MTTKNSSDAEIIFNKAVEEDLIVNNASVSLLREFITSWTRSAVREDTFSKFLKNWLTKVLRLHKSNNLNKGSCLVTIFVLEESLNCVNLDQDSQFHVLFSQLFIPLHKVIVSTCMTNTDEITSSNDAIIAFFRLHCSLSRTIRGLQLIRKYNSWKPLLSFYCKSNKFNFFIQNSCTEYIENLIRAELPDELFLFVEILNTCVHCIKNAIEKQHPFGDGVILRSLRILQLIFSKYSFHLNENSLRLISKQCTSLASYVRHLLGLSKDDIIINYSLKIYVLSRVFLSNTENVKNEDEVFRRFLAVACELLNENEKFYHHMPEIFSLEFLYEEDQSKLRHCATYLKMKTIGEYLTKLNITSQELTLELDSLIPESEIFDNFLRLYLLQLSSQNKISAVALNILKNTLNERDSMDERTRIHFIRFYGLILKLTSNIASGSSEEVNNLLLNAIHALSTLIVIEGRSLKEDGIISDIIKTVLRITQPDLRYPMVLRLSAFKLCHLILQKIGITSNETIDFLKGGIIQRMNDSCWEVRDSALEILNEALKGKKSSLINEEICKSLLIRLEDEESFVRATAYVVLTATLSFRNGGPLETYFDYNKLLKEIELRFHNETEDNVRENMIEFIIEAWHSFRIPGPLLMTIYKTIYKASTNDLHSEVRRKGMLFWKNLVVLLKNDQVIRESDDVSECLEKLCFSGCCQAIIGGIEDEYDEKVSEIASEALLILKSIHSTTTEHNKPTTEGLEGSFDRRLMNELPCSNLVESNFLNATQFISKYIREEFDHMAEWPTQKSELDLSEIMKCFARVTIDGSEINLKDCY